MSTVALETLCRSLMQEAPLPPRERSLARSQALKRYAAQHIPSCS